MEKLLLHELFELQAKKQPDTIAIKFSSGEITYQKLDQLSQTYANQLINKKTQVNHLVAVVMEKGWEQVVAVLSVLKAGSAYLPIDPLESGERLHYLLDVGEVSIVLTQNKYRDSIEWPEHISVIAIDIEKPLDTSSVSHSIPAADDLAYVIFTSGSTGTPKGVMISHRSAMNTILDINERFEVNSKDKVFAVSSLTFDLSVYDIFGMLAAGGTIVIPDADQAKDPTRWQELFFKEGITIWNSAPALMDIFVEYLVHKKIPGSSRLRLALLSGDWIPLNLPQKILSLFENTKIISLGGATEASIWSILYEIKDIDSSWKSIPYGRAMKNQAFYILDEDLRPIRDDSPGELFIGGMGVAKGYWKDMERTKAQFIDHPVYGMIYKTGDLGRYLPDGNIEFLGRLDFQVKIAGCRVEINAVEKYLLEFPSIKQAAVLAIKEGANQKLVAYLSFDYNKKIKEKDSYPILEKEQVNYWQRIYNEFCQEKNIDEHEDVTLNTTGWVSSYYNESIPKIQMQEWVENTVKRIAALKPQVVLDVGCGAGLLLFQLAKTVKYYDATDFSKNAINYVKNQLDPLNINNVTLIECEAADIKKIEKTYDTILLNSVIQYFPSIEYLVDVLDQCVQKINDKGHIFIGDIRSLHLLDEFHASILLGKDIGHLDHTEWKNILERSVSNEDELVVDFNFFYKYKEKNSRISHIEILLKEGKFHNEMNCYRYDVILHIDYPQKEVNQEISWQVWDNLRACCLNIKSLLSNLIENRPNYLAIKNVPNKRTASLGYIVNDKTIFESKENWYLSYKEFLAKHQESLVDPEIFYEMANEHGYHVIITWSFEKPSECFDVIFIKQSYENFFYECLAYLNKQADIDEDAKDWGAYANIPLLPRINHKLILEIKKFLRERLPFYMIPSYFVSIKELPITTNGKIDRKALPLITQSFAEKEIIKPKTPVQKKLALIWQEILGIRNIGIKSNFYELGGTSLLAIQLIINIYNTFYIDLRLQELSIDTFNIENLSTLIERKMTVAKAN